MTEQESGSGSSESHDRGDESGDGTDRSGGADRGSDRAAGSGATAGDDRGSGRGDRDGGGDGAGRQRRTERRSASERSAGSDDGDVDLAAVCAELGLTPAQARRRLRQAPTWEQRAKDNYEAAQRAPTLEQQLDELRGQIADRDTRDVERNARMAMTQVNAKIAEAGVKPKDVADLLELVDPVRLLKDGEPDDDAIEKVAKSVTRTASRPAADRDQGQRGGTQNDMNSLIRKYATGR